MRTQGISPVEQWPEEATARSGVVVAGGYGVRISVWRGRLRVDDGVGADRRSSLFHRATSGLRRLVVLGHTGYVSLEAIRWLADIKAGYLQIDADGKVLAAFGPRGTDRPALRRAQAIASQDGRALSLSRWLVDRKLAAQAETLGRFAGLKHADEAVAIIAASRQAIADVGSIDEIRQAEAFAAGAYWQVFRTARGSLRARGRGQDPEPLAHLRRAVIRSRQWSTPGHQPGQRSAELRRVGGEGSRQVMVDYGHRLGRDALTRTTEGSRAIRRIAVIGAAAIAGAILGVAIAQMTIPSRAEMRQLATDLVPPDAALTDLAELSGPELLVGRYEAVAHFDTKGTPVDRISDQLLAHARAEGWTHVQTENQPGGDIQRWVRQEVEAAIYVRDLEGPDDGIVFVHYGFSPTDRVVIGLLLGGATGLGVAVGYMVVMRTVRRAAATEQNGGMFREPPD